LLLVVAYAAISMVIWIAGGFLLGSILMRRFRG
jgi:hypothetical protein